METIRFSFAKIHTFYQTDVTIGIRYFSFCIILQKNFKLAHFNGITRELFRAKSDAMSGTHGQYLRTHSLRLVVLLP